MKSNTPEAKLFPVQIEVGALIRGRPAYRWVEGYKIINPQGHELQPYLRKREAVAFCKESGWKPVISS